MKLNAEIILDNLRLSIPAEKIGTADEALTLERPEFCAGEELLKNHLYIVKAERLPRRAAISPNVTIICIGTAPQLTYYQERCCLIQVREGVDLFRVFNLVQDIFNRYDAWDESLREILERSASIEEMVKCSQAIFGNPMFVIDSNFHYLALAGYDGPNRKWIRADGETLELPTLGQFLELHEPSMHVREPLLLKLLDTKTLNFNLFQGEVYMGCLTIECRTRELRKSDMALGKCLSRMLVLALLKYSNLLTDERSMLRQVLQDVVDGVPIDYEQRRMLDAADAGKEYVCVKMRLNSRFAKLPLGYICNKIEALFKNGIAFARKGDILCFVETASIRDRCGEYREKLQETLQLFIDSMELQMGVSDAFSDLYSARLYYHQASAALENGSMLDPNGKYYVFQEYALAEMVINSLGKLPTELFFTEGMRRMAEHDASSPVSYMETLRVYLDRNMSITKTAAELFVHRSTLLERIARIERELGTDLRDPDERLRIQILLKAMQLHETLRPLQKRT